MGKNNCDYYQPKKKDKTNCPNCHNWNGERCKIEDKVLRNDKTDIVHESVNYHRSNRVTRVLR